MTALLAQFVTYCFVEGHLVFRLIFFLYKLCMYANNILREYECVLRATGDYVIIKGFERFLFVVWWCWEVSAGKCGRDYVCDH